MVVIGMINKGMYFQEYEQKMENNCVQRIFLAVLLVLLPKVRMMLSPSTEVLGAS